jgi:HEAT repeat protein
MRPARVLRQALALAVAASALAAPAAHAADPSSPAVAAVAAAATAKLERALESLPTPLDPSAVAAVIALVPSEDSDAALAVVDTLAAHGGYAAVQGIRRFLDHSDPFIRAAALRATAALRIRLAEGMYAVRNARSDGDPDVVLAAYQAIGAVGDASDVPTLLEAMASEDRVAVVAARDALRAMTGLRHPYRVKLWRQWWRETQELEAPRLPKALDLLVTSADPGDVEDARAVIERNAWLDVANTRERLETCFGSGDERVRAEAYRLAGRLRFGDLAEPLARTLRFERDRAAWDAGVAAAKELGVRVEGDPPPVAFDIPR